MVRVALEQTDLSAVQKAVAQVAQLDVDADIQHMISSRSSVQRQSLF